MSYARWSHSNWYVFWNTSSGDTKNTQSLSVWHVRGDQPEFSYRELKCMNFEEFLEKFPEDTQEGWGYVQEWLADVEEEFKDENTN